MKRAKRRLIRLRLGKSMRCRTWGACHTCFCRCSVYVVIVVLIASTETAPIAAPIRKAKNATRTSRCKRGAGQKYPNSG